MCASVFVSVDAEANAANEQVIKSLLEGKANVDAQEQEGTSSLMWASVKNNPPAVALMIAANASVDLGNLSGMTSLMWASQKGNAQVVQLLVEAQADVNGKDPHGWNALMWVCHDDSNGIDDKPPADADADAVAAEMKAKQAKEVTVANILLENAADLDSSNFEGQTALHIAAKAGKGDLVRVLLELGADVNATDKQGLTAVNLAVAHPVVEQLLNDFAIVSAELQAESQWDPCKNVCVIA